MGVIPTGRYECIKCPICHNIKEIEIMDVMFDCTGFRCDHIEKDYIERIEKQSRTIEKQRKMNLTYQNTIQLLNSATYRKVVIPKSWITEIIKAIEGV